MAQGAHRITQDFEKALADYTGAPFAVALDNQSNALFLSLYYEKNILKRDVDKILLPRCTYPSVPAECIHAGYKVSFMPASNPDGWLTGSYLLYPTQTVDSALRFTADMYIPETFMCLSFTGPYKSLKLGKGGAILTDSYEAYKWFKKARFSGRNECSYMVDDFDINPVLGWNFYMPVDTAARGLHMMPQFYNEDGSKKDMPDLKHRYPDLSKFKIYAE